MKRILFLLIALNSITAFSQTNLCNGAMPFCTGTNYNFPAPVGGSAPDPGVDYGCLSSTPNPVWYYLKVATSGNITLHISGVNPTDDIDFACWGPFTSPTNGCVSGLTNNCGFLGCFSNTSVFPFTNYPSGNLVDCSYDSQSSETCTIPNAIAGEYYKVMITNFGGNPTSIVFNQTNTSNAGAGSTDCSIVAPCVSPSITCIPSACNTNTYSLVGVVTFSNAPSTGSLIVSSYCGGNKVLLPPFVSPLTFTISNLTANGSNCAMTAIFTGAPSCNTMSTTYQAPSSCSVSPSQCVISQITNVISACNSNTYSISGTITFTNAPSTGSLAIGISPTNNIIFTSPFVSPTSFTLSNLPANASTNSLTAIFSASMLCNNSITYFAPSSCNTTTTPTSTVVATNTLVFPFTGQVEHFSIPCGVNTIHVKAWGGGGSGGGADAFPGAIGGGGGFIESDISVTPNQTLTVIIGGGALGGGSGGSIPGGAGGFGFGLVNGANGGNSGPSGGSGSGGGGGAGSALFSGTTPLVVAAGGGGGSGGGQFSSGGAGGGGGQNGLPAGGSGCSSPGLTGASSVGNGQSGTSHTGDGGGGGGGGGGYLGGTGGNIATSCDCGACGGAGGSSYSSGLNTVIMNANGSQVGNNTDSFYTAGVGIGGNSSTKGGDGLIVITYIAAPSPTITSSANGANICMGQQTASLSAFGGLTYTWIPANSLSSSSSSSVIASPSVTTTYSVIGANSFMCTDTAIVTVIVYTPPTAHFLADSVCFYSPSHLLDASNGNGNPITSYAWDFTNDNLADVTGPNAINYTMPLVGNNTVNYTVTSTPTVGLSCKTATTINVYTFPNPVASFNFVNKCINAQPNTFDASASNTNVGTIVDYSWNFGDGQTDNSPLSTTTNHYNLATLYNVTLTVTTNKGCTNSITQQVEVYEKPLLNITSQPNVCIGSPTTFTAQTLPNSGNVIAWFWDVNNTLNSIETNGQQSSYTFGTEGWQILNLIASTDKGCKDTLTRNVYINYLPKPEFIVDKPKGCPLPHCVTFTDQTPAITGPAQIKNWSWNFGNGASTSSASGSNQSTCYTNSSSNQLALFTVTLTTKTDSGCVASNIKPNFITVYPTPIANYTIVPDFGNVVVPLVHFDNQSVDYSKWYWTFGDGPKIDSVNVNPAHTYSTTEANSYHSQLIVVNQYGCKDTTQLLVDIAPDFVFYIPNSFTPNGDNINDGFIGVGIGIEKYEMWIYERWGTNVYYTNDITKPWTGVMLGKSEEAPQDVYSWKVELKDVFGKKHNYVGHVTLLR